MGCRQWMTLNRRLLPVKATYFFTLGGVAALLPYLAIYMRQIGLSPSESALIYGTMPFLGAFFRFLIGGIADKTRRHKAILIILCFLTGILHTCLLFVPKVSRGSCDLDVRLACSANNTRMTFCPELQLLNAASPALDDQYTILDDPKRPNSSSTRADSGTFSGCVVMCDPVKSQVCFEDDKCIQNNCEFDSNLTCVDAKLVDVSYSIHENCYHSDVRHVSVDYFQNESVISAMSCPQPTEMSCKLTCSGANFSNLEWTDCYQEPKYSVTFWIFFVVCLLAQMAYAPIFTLVDAMTYSHLGEERHKWGWNRLWGSVGFAVFALISAISMEVFQKSETEKNYTYSFIMFAVLNMAASVVVYFYKFESDVVASQVLRNVGHLLKRLDISSLLISVFAFGAYTGLMQTFLFWHLETLGAGKVLFGLCIAANSLPEILVLLLSGAVIRRFGHVACLYLVYVAYAVRLFVYSVLVNPWYVLFVEPLHSITFGLMYAAATSYGSLITPPGMHGTVQGLIGALHFGAGKGMGSVLGGFIYQKYGAQIMFQSYGMSAVILLVIYFCVNCFIIRPAKKKAKLKAKEKKEEGEKPDEEMKMLNGSTILEKNVEAET